MLTLNTWHGWLQPDGRKCYVNYQIQAGEARSKLPGSTELQANYKCIHTTNITFSQVKEVSQHCPLNPTPHNKNVNLAILQAQEAIDRWPGHARTIQYEMYQVIHV